MIKLVSKYFLDGPLHNSLDQAYFSFVLMISTTVAEQEIACRLKYI